MPSRAVLRKKQRRDTKRKKAEEGGGAPSHRTRPAHLDEDENAARSHRPALPPPRRSAEGREGGAAPASRKRAADPSLGGPSPSASPTTQLSPAAASLAHPAKRARTEAAAPAPMPEGLSRKERHRWETSQRLERQMTRLSTTAAATKEMLDEAAAQQPGTHGAPTAEGPAAEVKLRHDPKFRNGTFWRDRKEKRARTLFLGGIPASFTVKQVKDFISTVVDSDPNAIDYVDQIGKETEVVEEVDMLPAKHQGKVKHMYVTMASVALAGCAAAMLDRYKVEGRELRCNFAADKTQREEAIRRRDAARS